MLHRFPNDWTSIARLIDTGGHAQRPSLKSRRKQVSLRYQHALLSLRHQTTRPTSGEIFQKISGGRGVCGGFGHPGGDVAGSGEVARGKDAAEVRA